MDGYEKVLDSMRRLCSMREYCSSDIKKKVLAKVAKAAEQPAEGAEAVAKKVLDSLIKDGYLDDVRYAEAFARDKSAIAGWGRVKIRNALVLKGIDSEIIASALENIDSVKAREKMEKALSVKAKSIGAKPDARMRLLRFAAGRGYSYAEAARVIDDILSARKSI